MAIYTTIFAVVPLIRSIANSFADDQIRLRNGLRVKSAALPHSNNPYVVRKRRAVRLYSEERRLTRERDMMRLSSWSEMQKLEQDLEQEDASPGCSGPTESS